MELNVVERLLIAGLLPEKGSFTNLKLIRVAKENLSFTDEEHKVLNFSQTPGPDGQSMTKWEDGIVGEKEIKIGEVVTEMIKKQLRELSEKEELLPQQESLFEKFVVAS